VSVVINAPSRTAPLWFATVSEPGCASFGCMSKCGSVTSIASVELFISALPSRTRGTPSHRLSSSTRRHAHLHGGIEVGPPPTAGALGGVAHQQVDVRHRKLARPPRNAERERLPRRQRPRQEVVAVKVDGHAAEHPLRHEQNQVPIANGAKCMTCSQKHVTRTMHKSKTKRKMVNIRTAGKGNLDGAKQHR